MQNLVDKIKAKIEENSAQSAKLAAERKVLYQELDKAKQDLEWANRTAKHALKLCPSESQIEHDWEAVEFNFTETVDTPHYAWQSAVVASINDSIIETRNAKLVCKRCKTTVSVDNWVKQ
jgi:hypothetical protein